MRLTRPDDTIDHCRDWYAGQAIRHKAGCGDEFLSGAIVQTDREPLDFERFLDLAGKGFKVSLREAGRTGENEEGNLNPFNLAIEIGEEDLYPLSDIALDLRSFAIHDAHNRKTRQSCQGEHGNED